MTLVFATNNKHKLEEVRSMLSDRFTIVGLEDIGCREEIEETESTLEGNSKIKSDFVSKNYSLNCFADDTGLEVEALDGAPGVYSARYAGENATFEDNVNKLLTELRGESNRKARFRTVISLKLEGKQYFFEGVCNGEITVKPAGEKGFGYDPVFRPEGSQLTFAEMDMEQKSRISHRGQAVQKLVTFLNGEIH
jgi:XTP/dITP diphosphohydrolase